jgi:hypothetical protein
MNYFVLEDIGVRQSDKRNGKEIKAIFAAILKCGGYLDHWSSKARPET